MKVGFVALAPPHGALFPNNKISPIYGRHVFMLIKLVLVLFVKVKLLTILDSGHMLHRTDFEVPYTGLYGKFALPMATMQETFLPNYFKIRQGFLTRRFSKILPCGCHGNSSSVWIPHLWSIFNHYLLRNIPVKCGKNWPSSLEGDVECWQTDGWQIT